MTGADAGDDISETTRRRAQRVRERAATMPSAADIAGMTAGALSEPGRDVSAAEISEMFTEAVSNAERVSYLLGRLAALLGEPDGGK